MWGLSTWAGDSVFSTGNQGEDRRLGQGWGQGQSTGKIWGRPGRDPRWSVVPARATQGMCCQASTTHPSATPRLPALGDSFLPQGLPGSSFNTPAASGAPKTDPCRCIPSCPGHTAGGGHGCAAQVCSTRVRVHPLPSAEGVWAAHPGWGPGAGAELLQGWGWAGYCPRPGARAAL